MTSAETYDKDKDDDKVPRQAGKYGQLTPFVKGDPRASEAGRRGVASREAKRAAARKDADAVAAHLRTLAASYERKELGPIAVAAALDAIGRVHRGEWKVRDPADWVRVLVDVARLEEGMPTSTSIVAHVGTSEILALRDQARAMLSATATAADDIPGHELAQLGRDTDNDTDHDDDKHPADTGHG